MQLDIQKYLFDIKVSIDSINEYLGDKRDFHAYKANWVIHGYDKIDDVIIWGIISRQLPILKKQVEDLLE